MEKKLIKCFLKVFPNYSPKEFLTLGSDTCEEWDSITVIRLIITVETEFGIRFTSDEMEKMDSFQSFMEVLTSR